MMWWWIVFAEWLFNETLFPAGTIARDSHHRKYPKHHEQILNQRKIWVQILLNEVVQ